MKIVPYLWPRHAPSLQLLALACLVLLVLGRGVNVLVPQLLGRVIKALGTYDPSVDVDRRVKPWGFLAGYIVLRLCQGGSGMLAVMQNMLVRFCLVIHYQYLNGLTVSASALAFPSCSGHR